MGRPSPPAHFFYPKERDAMEIVNGNIIEFNRAQYIAHQCNCVTDRSAGVAASIFKAFPWSDIYSQRTEHSKPGTIEIRGNGKDQRLVVNMFAQFYPGKPKFPDGKKDGYEARKAYFKSCINRIVALNYPTHERWGFLLHRFYLQLDISIGSPGSSFPE